MLQDEIVLDIDLESPIKVFDIPVIELTIDVVPEIENLIKTYVEADVIVDLESMGSDSGSIINRYYNKISALLLFTKAVSGFKTTFAKVSLDVHNTIQTIGTSYIDPANHNLLDFPITFIKSVLGHKTTFGQSSLVITSNIQVDASSTVGNIDFYGSDAYGSGTYGSIIGYGDGIYGANEYGSGKPRVSLPITFGSTILGHIEAKDSISLPITFGLVISGNKSAKQTAVAEISLASHGAPTTRTNHSIKIRARTTSGSTGVIKAALYEGAVNKSGDLTSGVLSNSLADYTLAISDAAADSITDYSNLSIKIWGYDANGGALVFEIARLYLELPVASSGTTYYGAVSRSFTFGKAVSGVSSKKTAVAEISLASHNTPSARTNHSIKVRARTTTGSTGVIKAALYEGSTNRSGDLSSTALNNSLADYTLAISDAAAASITSYANLSLRFWGFDSAGNALVFEVSRIYLELPTG